MASTAASDIGHRIALLRRRLGLSQVAFARQAGISRGALSEYERGNSLPKTARIARIAEAGGTTVDWLLNGRARRTSNREDPEFEAVVEALRTVWRDLARRRVVIAVLEALGQR